ncbi:hypothetical protein [Caulobacter sp. D4A]|nr:hypothetical protein [Caulobacter sp. D4A]
MTAKAADRGNQRTTSGDTPMLAILIIAIFLGVIVGLNAFEFGRID